MRAREGSGVTENQKTVDRKTDVGREEQIMFNTLESDWERTRIWSN